MRRPVLAALLAFFLLSLIGIPFTGGFFGKFYVFSAAIQAGHVWLAVIGLLNSGVACFYYLRLLSSIYTKAVETASKSGQTDASLTATPTISVPAGIGLTLAAAATLLLGILPGNILHLANSASSSLRASAATTRSAASSIDRQSSLSPQSTAGSLRK
jgi:NADH-quinone oxidoreductase subunit N